MVSRSDHMVQFVHCLYWRCGLAVFVAPACVRLSRECVLCSEYIAALSQYRQRKWTCMRTGASGLTYEEALTSEANLKVKVWSPCCVPSFAVHLRRCQTQPSHGFSELALRS